MPEPTVVKGVTVTGHCHSPLHQPKNGVKPSGKSEITWVVKGTYSAHNQCVVVVEAGKKRDKGSAKVNKVNSGGIFSAGTDGTCCELTLESNDQDNWTVSVATDKDVTNGDEIIFQAGTGGGGL